MLEKDFKGNKLYFTKVRDYIGPVTLMYRPNKTIFQIMDNYVIEYDGRYYIIDEVKYQNVNYSFSDFVLAYPDVLGF